MARHAVDFWLTDPASSVLDVNCKAHELGNLLAVIAFQLLFASVFLGVLHQPAFHHTPVAVTGSPRLAAVLARQERGAIDLLPQPSAAAAQAAIHDGRAYGAIVGGRRGTTLLIASAASPGTASLLTRQLTKDAAVTGTPLLVFAAGAATAGLQAALGPPGTLIAIVAMVAVRRRGWITS